MTDNRLSQDSNHPDDLFQSRYVAPGFKPFSYFWKMKLLTGLPGQKNILAKTPTPGIVSRASFISATKSKAVAKRAVSEAEAANLEHLEATQREELSVQMRLKTIIGASDGASSSSS